MRIGIIIPTHNEEAYIAQTLDSLLLQDYTNYHILVVNDNSTDNTSLLLQNYLSNEKITVVYKKGDDRHLPGSKVVEAFYYGLEKLQEETDIVCKFDADLIFPKNYLQVMVAHFTQNPKLGMFGGILYSLQQEKWQYENIAKKSHIRGPIKAYRKECFRAMAGIRPSIGWDTIDVLLANFYGYETKTDTNLIVRHCKPTGAVYHGAAKYKQGEALYRMRYDFGLALLTAIKQSIRAKSLFVLWNYLMGYILALSDKNTQPIVSKTEGAFIRKFRWSQIGKH